MVQDTRKDSPFTVLGDNEEIYGIAGMPFVPGIKVPAGCDLVFVSGVMGIPVAHDEPDGPTDIRSEAHRAFRRLGEVLAMGGATFDDVVMVTKFIVDAPTNNPVVAEVMAEYFDNMPTSTTVEVPRLMIPIKMEVNAIAAVRPE